MPLKPAMLLACKDGVVELTAEVVDPERDTADTFVAALRERLNEHQYEIMTDTAILNPADLAVASCITSRDPLPGALHDALISLGFEPVGSEGGAVEESSIFSRFQKSRRTRLDKWRAPYLRARDLSPRLGEFESSLIEDVPDGALPDVHEECTAALITAARTHLRQLLAPGLDGITAVQELILKEKGAKKGRLVFHPAAVRALAAFAGDAIIHSASDSEWSEDPDDEDAPLFICARGGTVVRSDPVVRVVNFLSQGRKALLSDYAETCLRQSLTAGD